MLEVTARNEKGENIFSGEQIFEMVGFDEKGARTFDSWKIRKINASGIIPADGEKKKTFELTPPAGTQSITLEAVLSYHISPDAQPVLMSRTSNTLTLKKK